MMTYGSINAKSNNFAVRSLSKVFLDIAIVQPAAIKLIQDILCIKNGDAICKERIIANQNAIQLEMFRTGRKGQKRGNWVER